jgi:membrane protein DedA with SNARE-associated domain
MLNSLLATHGLLAYASIFGVLVASAFGFPVPEDLSLIAGGILVHLGQANPFIMALVCYLGILLGDLIIYRIGWISGPSLFRKRGFRRHLTSSRLKTIRRNLEERTFVTILIARHLFYLRTATFLVCGAVRVAPARFIIADAIAALITAPLMLCLGFLFAEHHEVLLDYVKQVKSYLVIGGLALAGYLVWRYRRRS